MSIRSLSIIASQRDSGPPLRPGAVVENDGIRTAGPEGAQRDANPAGASTIDVLLGAIPTEIVASYTAVIGVVMAALVDKPEGYLPLRWGLYALFTVFTVVSLLVSYRGRTENPQRLPWLEIAAAVLAFGAWGLVMPQSPLFAILEEPALAISVGLIATLSAFVLSGILAPLLKKPANSR